MRKPAFCIYAKTKTQISFAVTAKLISAFVFATRIVQFLYFLNPKFQASSHLLWLYSLVCVGPVRKLRRPIFSQRGSYYLYIMFMSLYISHGWEASLCRHSTHIVIVTSQIEVATHAPAGTPTEMIMIIKHYVFVFFK